MPIVEKYKNYKGSIHAYVTYYAVYVKVNKGDKEFVADTYTMFKDRAKAHIKYIKKNVYKAKCKKVRDIVESNDLKTWRKL